MEKPLCLIAYAKSLRKNNLAWFISAFACGFARLRAPAKHRRNAFAAKVGTALLTKSLHPKKKRCSYLGSINIKIHSCPFIVKPLSKNPSSPGAFCWDGEGMGCLMGWWLMDLWGRWDGFCEQRAATWSCFFLARLYKYWLTRFLKNKGANYQNMRFQYWTSIIQVH